MKWRWYLVLFLLFCLAIFQQTGMAEAGDQFPAPTWMEKTAVADEMLIHGRSSKVIYFQANRGVDAVLAYYRQRWNDGSPGHPGYREKTFPPWTVISRLDGLRLFTVQVKGDGEHASGYLAETNLKSSKKSALRMDIPKMSGSRILNDLTSRDPGQIGRTILITNHHSLEANNQFYRNYYREHGWANLADIAVEKGQTLVYAHDGQEAHLVIMPGYNTTNVVITVIEKE